MATITIPKLDKRARFEKNQRINTAGGPGNLDNFSPLVISDNDSAETWMGLRKKSGNRNLDYGEIVESNQYEGVLRYREALFNALNNEGVESIRIILDDNRKFAIATWELVNEKKDCIKFTLNEMR